MRPVCRPRDVGKPRGCGIRFLTLAIALTLAGCSTQPVGAKPDALDTAATKPDALDTAATKPDALDTAAAEFLDADQGSGAADSDVAAAPLDVSAEVTDVSGPTVDTDGPALADAAVATVVDASEGSDADSLADSLDVVDAAGTEPEVGDADASGDTATGDDGGGVELPPVAPIDPTTLPPAAFTDVTLAYGIDPGKAHSICVAAADLDGNGSEDLVMVERTMGKAKIHAVLLGGAKPAHVLTPFDTTLLLPTTGCTLVDMDSDGTPDLLVGGQSGAALYMGDGKGGFVDQSAKWLPFIMDFESWSLAPVDLDGDGDLDLFIGAGSPSFDASNPGPGPACGSDDCGYKGTDFVCALVTKLPNVGPLQDRVLIQGAKLPLEDQTPSWNVPPAGVLSAGLPVDIDLDGLMDVLVSDDFGAHRLLHNVGGSFEAHSEDIGFYPYAHGMGWGMGDFNGDGLADLMLADVGPSPLYLQTKAGPGLPVSFVDMGGALGVWGPVWSASIWSPMVADFDLDGNEDIMVGGALNTLPADLAKVTMGCSKNGSEPYAGHPNIDLIFLSEGGKGFKAQQFPTGPTSHFMAIAQAVVDIDGDGDLDVLQSRPSLNLTSRIRLWRNDLPKKGKGFRVLVKGKKGNLDALGAVVTAKIGGQLRTRWLTGTGGFGGNRSRIAEFGLGPATKATDVTVSWPDGKKTLVGEVMGGASKSVTWP